MPTLVYQLLLCQIMQQLASVNCTVSGKNVIVGNSKIHCDRKQVTCSVQAHVLWSRQINQIFGKGNFGISFNESLVGLERNMADP